ncbi:tripartite motif-containing protein 16-like [Megalops cyprinoides]|uniref:tripartite motif-containing protein 16-like n=1 Tax=Megalops cyprinoides TaxID=118141 RepID=UPI001864A6F5|nr:tripartite motif-containing protein 16-like [Megalops cyprinoides]
MFAQRPALTAGLAHFSARPGEVPCDVCSGRKFRAVKTCLRCLASYCRPHLQTHLDTPALRRHELVNPIGQVQGKICPRHNRVLEVYCYTDQTCICSLCVMDEHRNHDTVSAAARREEKQSQLETMKRRSEEIIQQREEDLQELEESIDSFMESTQAAEEEYDRVFRQLIHSIQSKRLEVKEQIRRQGEAETSRARMEKRKLEQGISELQKRDAELEELLHTQDHIHFLQRWPSLHDSFQDENLSRDTIHPLSSFELKMTALTRLREHMENMCKEESDKISKAVKEVHMFKGPDTRTKPNQPDSSEVTLDPDTANKKLCVFEGNRKVTSSEKSQSYPNLPQRFDHWVQVLCYQGMTGPCYWEVEWSGRGVFIGVAYGCISRKGKGLECSLKYSANSWSLFCSQSKYSACHNSEETEITVPIHSPRVGVYLDYREGTLTFYSVSNTLTILHTFQTSFSQPLYPAFGLELGSSIKLCQLQWK